MGHFRYIASHVRVDVYHLNFAPFWKTFVTRKMTTILKSGLYSTFSNSTIVNKNKQVSHSKQEAMGVIFTHPSPNPLASPKYSMTNLM